MYSGVSWYAASRTDLTIGCRAKMEVVSLLQRWKSQLGCECTRTVSFLKTELIFSNPSCVGIHWVVALDGSSSQGREI